MGVPFFMLMILRDDEYEFRIVGVWLSWLD